MLGGFDVVVLHTDYGPTASWDTADTNVWFHEQTSMRVAVTKSVSSGFAGFVQVPGFCAPNQCCTVLQALPPFAWCGGEQIRIARRIAADASYMAERAELLLSAMSMTLVRGHHRVCTTRGVVVVHRGSFGHCKEVNHAAKAEGCFHELPGRVVDHP